MPRLGVCCLCWLLLISGALVARGAAPLPFVERSSDDVLIFALQLNTLELTDEIEGYPSPHGILLPLGQICQVLDLGITVTPAVRSASGFIISPARKFSLNLDARTVLVAGRTLPVDVEQLEVHHNDIYLTRELFEAWLPLRMTVDTHTLVIQVQGREPLPIQRRLEREMRGAPRRGSDGTIDAGFPRLKTPYHLFSVPNIDQTLNLTAASSPLTRSTRDITYTSVVTADAGYLSALGYFSGSTAQGQSSSRLTFSREDREGGLLGGLRARDVEFGDIALPSVPLLASAQMLSGVTISNYPLDQQSSFDTHTFQGTLLPDWDVELYRDSELIGYQPASSQGQFTFRDVPLLYGLNLFRLVFYGPHGERREEQHLFNVGQSLARAGQFYYRMTATQPEQGLARLIDQCDVGLTNNVTASAAYANTGNAGDQHSYVHLGLRGYRNGVFARLDAARDPTGAWGSELGLQTRVANTSVTLDHLQANGFESVVVPGVSQALQYRTSLRLDGIPLFSTTWMQPLSLQLLHENHTDGAALSSVIARTSWLAKSYHFTNYMTCEDQKSAGVNTTTATGSLIASGRLRKQAIRGEVDYGLAPGFSLSRIAISTESARRSGKTMSATLAHDLQKHDEEVSLNLSKPIGLYAIGVTVSASTQQDWSLGLNLFSSLMREPRTAHWLADARPFAQQGSASARVFLDENGNNRWDPGEPVLPGVGFMVNDAPADVKTSADGVALLRGLTRGNPVDISVATGTLDDPLWVPVQRGVRVVTRPGDPVLLDFPVRPSGEITGTIYQSRAVPDQQAAGMTVQMVDGQGAVKGETRSAYDGFYTFSQVPVGQYTLRLAAVPSVARHLDIPAKGGFVDGMDLVLPAPGETPGTSAALPVVSAPLPLRFAVVPAAAALFARGASADPDQSEQPVSLISPAFMRVYLDRPRRPMFTEQDTTHDHPLVTCQPAPAACTTRLAAPPCRLPLPADLPVPSSSPLRAWQPPVGVDLVSAPSLERAQPDVLLGGRFLAVRADALHVPESVYFADSQAEVTPELALVLQSILHAMHQHPALMLYLATEDGAEDTALTRRRIEACRGYLLGTGIAPHRVTAARYAAPPPMPAADPLPNRRVHLEYFVPIDRSTVRLLSRS